MSAEITHTSTGGNAPDEVRKFVEKMSKAHDCKMLVARETNGYHLYIPCPECLHTHGRREVADPKYSINVSMYLGLGDAFADLKPQGPAYDPAAMEKAMASTQTRDEKSSICMRTRQSKNPHRFKVSALLSMATVHERHPDIMTKADVVGQVGSAEREAHWEVDPESGVLVPPPPGTVVAITALSPDHPAVTYLTSRGYSPQKLWEQFRCSFCVEEYPEGENGIYYRKMPGGWKDTPQNRVIFYSLVKGVPLTWQARYPEKVSENGLNKFMLHPYRTEEVTRWSHVATRANPQSAWIPVSPFDEVNQEGTLRFQPSKYRTAKYSQRQMMGWDAAVKRANDDPNPHKWVVLCEGPLDAARVGPGGVALIGSSISPDNAEKVASTFNIVFTAFDEDKAGKGATEKVGRMLMGSKCRAPVIQLVIPLPIPSGKDIGEMTQEAFDAMLAKAIKRSQRGR
jgi:hypothetical protein